MVLACDAIVSLGTFSVLILLRHLDIAVLNFLVICIVAITISLVPWCEDRTSCLHVTLRTLLLLQGRGPDRTFRRTPARNIVLRR